jgi:hypothetical protein
MPGRVRHLTIAQKKKLSTFVERAMALLNIGEWTINIRSSIGTRMIFSGALSGTRIIKPPISTVYTQIS